MQALRGAVTASTALTMYDAIHDFHFSFLLVSIRRLQCCSTHLEHVVLINKNQ
jgi:hypothetical protein